MSDEEFSFTGERYLPEIQGEIRFEHLHRYSFALTLAKNKQVLDIASGEGYGSAILAGSASYVVGVDISADAISHAQSHYSHLQNIKFAQGSATDIELPDNHFDLVVSFETIEHLYEQEEMVAEIRRVLKPEGILVISTPNRPIYNASRNSPNEFHVKELDFPEFDTLLRRHFGFVEYYGQRLMMGTVIQSLERLELAFQAYRDDGDAVTPHTGRLYDPTYFIAVCGDKAELPTLPASVLYPESTDLLKHYVGFAEWAQNQDRRIKRKDEQILRLRNDVERLLKERGQFCEEVLRAESQLELLKELLGQR